MYTLDECAESPAARLSESAVAPCDLFNFREGSLKSMVASPKSLAGLSHNNTA